MSLPGTPASLVLAAGPGTGTRLRTAFESFFSRLEDRAPNLVLALLCVALSVLVAGLARRVADGWLRRTGSEVHVQVLVAKLAYLGVLLVGLLVALSLAGVNLGLLVGSLGLATVALGFALQDIVANFVSGIVLLLEHPFTRGDLISCAGVEGVVEDIRIRATRLRTTDGQQVVVPNRQLFTNALTNSSATVRRRVDVTVTVPGGADLRAARADLLAAVPGVDGVAADPAPRLVTKSLAEQGTELSVEVWVDPRATDLSRVRSDVLDRAQVALRQTAAPGGPR